MTESLVEHQRHLAASLALCQDEFPDVSVSARTLHGDPGRVLVRHSAHAALLVVGSRGHTGLAGLVLGSVSSAVVARARCPVAVVHDRPVG